MSLILSYNYTPVLKSYCNFRYFYVKIMNFSLKTLCFAKCSLILVLNLSISRCRVPKVL
jgi:hypothetical protein